MADYEKLGAFYLGRVYDDGAGEVKDDEPVLYDSKDLTTHALCVGMTGSGKTGLGVALLEEAVLDGIPVIAIDPKGDLGNLLLAFPDLAPADFEPWIDAGSAARKGRTVEEHAKKTADLWKNGLADWGQDSARIERYKTASRATIYTPGSSAGAQISLLRSFAAPAQAVVDDEDALRERVSSAVSGLLALMGINADPVRSREHILLSMMLDAAWRDGKDLDLPGLIRGIQTPPFERVGVFDLESFFPEKDRFELAMSLNNLVASPGFAAWSTGEPLSVQSLLYDDAGNPKLSILSIAHLGDDERMFFVTTILSEIIAWMRAQPGTQSLRALLYMDEVFGYFPPSANPPSKTPMLTLLKQARAFGLGCVLATQNPVDLDYKGLSNCGTWFLGRLQTERDKARVIDGLEGASAAAGSGFDRQAIERTLSGMDSRVFLMNNVHEDEPVLFHTRWVLSYLAGPLTRTQIATLHAERSGESPDAKPAKAKKKAAKNKKGGKTAKAAEEQAAEETASDRPMVPPGIEERFLPVARVGSRDARLIYRPSLFARTTLHFKNSRLDVDEWRRSSLLARMTDDVDIWSEPRSLPAKADLMDEPESGATFSDLPAKATRSQSYKTWEKQLKTALYRDQRLSVWRCKALKEVSAPGATEGEFRARIRDVAREARDTQLEKLRAKYAPKVARAKDQILTAEERIEREADQHKQQKLQAAISLGSTVLGALFGRKLRSSSTIGSATTAMRGFGRSSREKADIRRAQEKREQLEEKLVKLEEELEEKLAEITDEYAPEQLECELVEIKPMKSDIAVDELVLCWAPWRVDADGIAEPGF